jgi:hypothetical protein
MVGFRPPLTKLLPGKFDVRLNLKRKNVIMGVLRAFTMMPPRIEGISPASGLPGDLVTIRGGHFGTTK